MTTRRAAARLVTTTLLLAGIPTAGLAQPAAHASPEVLSQDVSRRVHIGDDVLVLDWDNSAIRGRVVEVTSIAVVLATKEGRTSVPAARVARITHQDSNVNGMRIGGLAGLAGGAFFGGLLDATCRGEGSGCPGAIVLLAGIGAGIGGGIGAGSDALHHRTMYASSPDAPRESQPSVTTGIVGATMTNQRLRLFAAPPALSGAWTYIGRGGTGVDLEATRSIGEHRTSIACVPVPDFRVFPASLVGTCAGSGFEGLAESSTMSASLIHAFAHSQVRPYASVGVAMETTTLLVADVTRATHDASLPIVIQRTSRQSGLGAVIGAGAWIRLSRHASLRPRADVLLRSDATTVRASVGLTYGW